MRWTMGSRYARVLPEPVSAWMKASESSTSSCVIAAFWMAVGALRESFVRRWVARVGERPREVKVSRSEDRGALEGVGGGMSLERGSFVGAAVVGGVGGEEGGNDFVRGLVRVLFGARCGALIKLWSFDGTYAIGFWVFGNCKNGIASSKGSGCLDSLVMVLGSFLCGESVFPSASFIDSFCA